jgi:hypothetical protein
VTTPTPLRSKIDDTALEIAGRLIEDRDEARRKALQSLAKYKFAMFGYWAGIWVHLNRIIGDRQPNPFTDLVNLAREHQEVKSW